MSKFREITDAELDALIERVNEAIAHNLSLSLDDLRLLLDALVMLAHLQERLADHDITLQKLRKLAGIVKSSEQLKDVVPEAAQSPSSRRRKKKPAAKTQPPPVIHQRCHHPLEGLVAGQQCPECLRGKLYKFEPAVVLRISGQTPLTSTQHSLQRLRCNTCGAYFTADLSAEAKQDGTAEQQYGHSARALMGIQKYFMGAPFYRQQTLQQLLGFPVSASTVFDQCEHLANALQPVFTELVRLSGNAVHYYLDDTTNRILTQGAVEKPDRRTGKLKQRTGIYTSGVIATLVDGPLCILYQTNVGHAGEWLDEILTTRPPTAPPPLIMCDALSRNRPSVLDEYHLALCNTHGRREFVEIATRFPEPVTRVLTEYKRIWVHEEQCHALSLSPAQRLAYHREHSLPVMERIRDWGRQQLDTEVVEANSGLGKAIQYFTNHFSGLTAFCRLEGAAIDNNVMEQALKLIIRGRKNALFFKTPAGAAIADVITSVVATAYQAQVNAFDYLVVVQRHRQEVRRHPERWLPWNYQQNLDGNDNREVINQALIEVEAEKKVA